MYRDTFQLKQWMLSLFTHYAFQSIKDPPQVRYCKILKECTAIYTNDKSVGDSIVVPFQAGAHWEEYRLLNFLVVQKTVCTIL